MTDNPISDGSRTSADDELADARRRALLPTSSTERMARPSGRDDEPAPAAGGVTGGGASVARPDDDGEIAPAAPPPPTDADLSPDADPVDGVGPVTDASPVADEGPVADEDRRPFADEDDVVDQRPVVDDEPVTDEEPLADEQTVALEHPDADEAPVADERDVVDEERPTDEQTVTGERTREHERTDVEDGPGENDTAVHPAAGTDDELDADSWDAAFASDGDEPPVTTTTTTETSAEAGTTDATATTATTAPATEDDDSWTPLFVASRDAVRNGNSAASADVAPDAAAGPGGSARKPDASGTDDSHGGTAALATGAAGLAASRSRTTPEARAADAQGTSGTTRVTGTTARTGKDEGAGLPDTWAGDAPQDDPPSRGFGTHLWVLLASLVLAPVAWYLIIDAGARLTAGTNTAWVTGDVVVEHVAELGAGVVLAFLLVLLARVSSIGAWVWGAVGTVLGVAWLVAPGPLSDLLQPVLDGLADVSGIGAVGENIAAHVVTEGSSGRLLLHGAVLVAIAVACHGARRAGRAEGAFVAEERHATRPRG